MANVLHTDISIDKHYKHSGFSLTIDDSYNPPASPIGIEWDGVNVLSSSAFGNKHYLHTGFSATTSDSYSTAWATAGVAWDGTDLYSVNSADDRLTHHSGFSSTINSSFGSVGFGPTGLSWDGSNLIHSDIADTNKFYLHSGFSSTISDSFASPALNPNSVTWDLLGLDLLGGSSFADKHYLFSGFSSTIDDSYDTTTNMREMSWDGRYALTLEQEGFRWREDDGSESTATWIAAQDTDITRPQDVTTRLRILVDADGVPNPPAQQFKIQSRKVGESVWQEIE